MDNNICPRCAIKINDTVLYKCVRCFTTYCIKCSDTKGGRLCPKCGMSQRMVISPAK